MSITKRAWIDREPDYEAIREEAALQFEKSSERYPYRLAASRFTTRNGVRERDRHWYLSLAMALRHARVDVLRINGGVFFGSQAELDRVEALAEKYYAGDGGLPPQQTRQEYREARRLAKLGRSRQGKPGKTGI